MSDSNRVNVERLEQQLEDENKANTELLATCTHLRAQIAELKAALDSVSFPDRRWK